jgi:hypothetical protein
MADRMDDAGFLPKAFAADGALGTEGRGIEARRAVASRLLDLRFPDQARALVGRADILPAGADRMILAEAAYQAGNAEIAESHLAGLAGPEVEALRAEYAPRPAMPPEVAEPAAEEEVAQAEAAPAGPLGSLAESRRLVEESRAVRERLRARLDGLAAAE